MAKLFNTACHSLWGYTGYTACLPAYNGVQHSENTASGGYERLKRLIYIINFEN